MIKALDLFCGAGGASAGLVRAGFEVTGVDIAPQPKYPYKFIQADALEVDLAGFDFVWASPPCQAHTLAQRIRKNTHADLIAPIRKRLAELGQPYVIENVVGAPLLDPIMLCGAMFPGLSVYRHRLFESSFELAAPMHPQHDKPICKMGRAPKAGDFMHVVGNFSGVRQASEAMGIHWMNRDGLREAIPPAYSEFIARSFLSQRRRERYKL